MHKKVYLRICIGLCSLMAIPGWAEPFHPTVDYVDLERFSGDWYVIALIPTPFEKKAVNGIENYRIDGKGNIRVAYSFRNNTPDGKPKVMYQKGWIHDRETNAEWRVQPLWPLRLPYYVIELDEDYSYTVIGTNNYSYLWIMAREPTLDSEVLEARLARMEKLGFDRHAIRMMEQRWD